MKSLSLAIKEIKEAWRYEPETGYFFWLYSPRYGITIGSRAGFCDFTTGYWRLRLQGKNFKASRIAWLLMTGEWPKDQIDHINGIKLDDRFCNLREASNRQNCCNRKTKATNKLGIKGVSMVSNRKIGYTATIWGSGRRYYLGYFSSAELARQAYDAAAMRLHGEFARPNHASI